MHLGQAAKGRVDPDNPNLLTLVTLDNDICFRLLLRCINFLSNEDHSHMFQADLSPSWDFPHVPKQAGSSSHEL